LQPLDTHAFFGFKSWLRRQYAELRGKSPNGMVCRLGWLKVMQSAKEGFSTESHGQKASATQAPGCLL
jgi:hypothetical protein